MSACSKHIFVASTETWYKLLNLCEAALIICQFNQTNTLSMSIRILHMFRNKNVTCWHMWNIYTYVCLAHDRAGSPDMRICLLYIFSTMPMAHWCS